MISVGATSHSDQEPGQTQQPFGQVQALHRLPPPIWYLLRIKGVAMARPPKVATKRPRPLRRPGPSSAATAPVVAPMLTAWLMTALQAAKAIGDAGSGSRCWRQTGPVPFATEGWPRCLSLRQIAAKKCHAPCADGAIARRPDDWHRCHRRGLQRQIATPALLLVQLLPQRPQIAITGTVSALDRPFKLQGKFPGGEAEFDYTPFSAGGGEVEYNITGSGVTGHGQGLYSLAAQPDNTMIIDQTTEGCIANSCRTNTDKIVLTPITP